MLKINSIALLLFATLFLTGCNWFGSTPEKSELIIINVLDAQEYDDCHILGSIRIDFDDFEAKMLLFKKQNHYVVYCADYACMSSGYCAQLLKKAKFEHVWAYEGGIVEWHEKGYPTQGPAQLEYLKFENEQMTDEPGEVPVITAEELLKKMEDFAPEQ